MRSCPQCAFSLGHLLELQAGYGTTRDDTVPICGDLDNGLRVNWNLLGDGVHTIRAFADLFGRAAFSVTTIGARSSSEVQTAESGSLSIAIFSLFSERRACKTSSLLAWDNQAGIQAEIWEQRRGRDSNPRYALAYTRLAGERHRPLGHLSQTPKRSRTDIGSGYYRFC